MNQNHLRQTWDSHTPMQDSPKLLENPSDMHRDELDHHFQGLHLLPSNIMTKNRCMENKNIRNYKIRICGFNRQ